MAHKVKHKEGWTKEEVKHAQILFDRAEKRKSPFIQTLDTVVFWALLLLGVLGAAVFSLYIVPLFLLLPALVLYPTSIFLGLLFGVLFVVVLSDLHWMSGKHYAFAMLVVLLTAFFSFFLFAHVANNQTLPDLLTAQGNAYLVGACYAFGMLLPYLYASNKKRSV